MSSPTKPKKDKLTVPALLKKYRNGEKLTMITAYDYTMARLVDGSGVEIILVGDSLGMVIQGHENTLSVSPEALAYHVECVARGTSRAHVMADMPFMSYQVSQDQAIENAGLMIKAGAQSIKLEGGEEISDLIWYLNKIGIPVMAHVGLKPQSVHTMGGYRTQGKTRKEADVILNDAQTLEEAGAFALLVEGVPMEVAKKINEQSKIPVIGIGSGPHLDGQVLVCYDILGADPDFQPRFVKNYANLHETATKAFSAYVQEVKQGEFPDEEHSTHRSLIEVKSLKKV